LKTKFGTLRQTHEQKTRMAQCAERVGFQEPGGPRSVSGEPIEDTTITESDGAEMLLTAHLSRVEVSNAWYAMN
jgi:hypothetical protein